MILLGALLLLLGFVLNVEILWVIGIVLSLVGALMFVLGSAGRPVGGRRHWF